MKRASRAASNVDPPGLEPGAFGLQSRRSTAELRALRGFGTPNSIVEVIEPQVPLRLPCYDLAPLAEPGFDPPKESEPHPDPTRVA